MREVREMGAVGEVGEVREEDQIVASILKCASILVKYIMINVKDTIKQHMYKK